MQLFIFTVLLLAVSTGFVTAQNKPRTDGDYDAPRCAPKVISGKNRKSPEFHFHRGERHRHSPVVGYEILESGEIAHAVLKRSSGVAEVDNYALTWVKGLKFNKRPGCGVVETTADITIDFR